MRDEIRYWCLEELENIKESSFKGNDQEPMQTSSTSCSSHQTGTKCLHQERHQVYNAPCLQFVAHYICDRTSIQGLVIYETSFESRHENMCLISYANNKGTDQPAHPRSLISAFVVRCLDSIISRNFKTLASFCGCASRFVSGRSDTPEDTFCHVAAHVFVMIILRHFCIFNFKSVICDFFSLSKL